MTTTTGLKLYNSMTKQVEIFKPHKENHIKIYICGPTVYDSPHVGHARTYVTFDIIRRILSDYFNYNVTLVMNITDIDDKIIKRANELGVDTSEVTKKFTDEFFDDMRQLNVREPSYVTKVTNYVEEIISFIEKLEKNGFAYESAGSVYFDLNKYQSVHNYPIFKSKDGIIDDDGEGDANNEKKSIRDFVLWKKSKENEPQYESKWGLGRPGWHIECSVMSSDILGDKLDMHAGGIDLAFPHHENEIAQCQAYFMKSPWVNYFLHTGHLNIDGLKMSKSLKNFITIKDILNKTTARQLRILFLHHGWNKTMNYDEEHLKFAENVEKRLLNFISIVNSMAKDVDNFKTMKMEDREIQSELELVQDDVHQALLNNMDTPQAMKRLLELINFSNIRIKSANVHSLVMVKNYVQKMIDIFGIEVNNTSVSGNEEGVAQLLASFRTEIRKLAKEKQPYSEIFKACDNIRESIKEYNFIIEDTGMDSMLRRQ